MGLPPTLNSVALALSAGILAQPLNAGPNNIKSVELIGMDPPAIVDEKAEYPFTGIQEAAEI